ncbi:MAG: DUF6933 domain-containing protein [Actinomycetota bacterium]
MALTRCTKLLLAHLPPHDAGLSVVGTRGVLGDWYAHLLILDRRKWLLFTNEETLFSFTVPYVRRPELKHFFLLFRDHLRSNLEAASCSVEIAAQLLADYDQLTVTNTDSRSVLGSMNDIAFRLQCYASGAPELAYREVLEVRPKKASATLLVPKEFPSIPANLLLAPSHSGARTRDDR